MTQGAEHHASVLNSWKEIANYLGRGVRTVQRWEAELNLPVHRIGGSDRSPVFSYKGELDNWLRKQAGRVLVAGQDPVLNGVTQRRHDRSEIVEKSVLLTSKVLSTLQKQRAYAKALDQQVKRMARLLPVVRKSQAARSAEQKASQPERSRAGHDRALGARADAVVSLSED